ncbi:hypothetical protein DUI87_00959 [Hirundo rustica rustica]|uniref:Uncharacterized protein n=1 Tax=Hirundo rustica rustica TaxID=333673 RepID=A0A3M0L4D4_HIRRU|nr:hypothetical protein DUI87_00959 [Hirundo rustica rustica]
MRPSLTRAEIPALLALRPQPGRYPLVRAEGQAGYEPLVQEQCQQTGMAALVQTLQLATPQQPFATIIQGIDEPFLCFAGRLTAVVEKQSSVSRTEDQSRGDGGFGSTGPPQVHWTAVLTKDCPETLCTVSVVGATPSEIHLHGLLDTKADPCALSGVRKQFPDAHVYHYMDDILVATPTQEELLRLQPQLLNALHLHGLQVAPEKVQQQPPWKYLGVKILERTIRHQEVQFVQSVKTLNDAQKLVGVITWLRPYLGLTTAQLSPLFELLKGDTDLKSPRELTPEARKVLEEVQQAVSACQVYRIEPSIDVTVFITTPDLHPTGIIGQWNDDWTDPLHVLEWVFLPHQPHKTATALFELIARLIIKCRQRCLQLMGADPSKIILPVQREEFDWSYANNVSLQSALEGFLGQITYHLPSHKLLKVAKNTQFSLRPKNRQEPVQGPTVFTDGSGKTGKAIVTWQDGSEWQITDSAYVANITQRLGCSVLKEVSNPALFDLLKALWCAIQARVHPYYVLHVRSHTDLPGFVAEGNARADKLANPARVAPQPDVLTQAKASHGFFHQNAHTLQKQFQLTATEAREIVESCDDCHALGAPLLAGVNPRGLKALELWQTDVTQVAEFGRLKYVHVTVDTFSSAMWASAHTGEKARDVIAHWRQAFAVLGIPSAVKTDNGPAYASQQIRQFLQSWGVSHNFGIPHSPTGQAIVERNHGTLKHVLQKQKRGMQGETPHSRLAKALYTINHLTVPQNSNNPVILNHHLSLQASDGEQQPRAKVNINILFLGSSAIKCRFLSLIYLLIVSVLLISATLGDMGIYMVDFHRAIQFSNIGTLCDESNPLIPCDIGGMVGRGNLCFEHPP